MYLYPELRTTWMSLASVLILGTCAVGAGVPMQGADIPAGAKWGACLNVQATENSEVFEFLSQVVAHERLDHLKSLARQEWSVDLNTLETISVFGADTKWDDVTFVARGDFRGVDLFDIPEVTRPWRGKYTIHRYAPLPHIDLLFSRHSDGVLIGADTVAGVQRALDVLDGLQVSHAELADQPGFMRGQFASSVCVMGLDVEQLKRELELESALLNGTSQAWFTLREGLYDVTADIHMDHRSKPEAAGAVSSMETILQRVLETPSTPPVIMEFLNALETRVDGNWVTASATGSSYDMVDLLQGLQALLKGN